MSVNVNVIEIKRAGKWGTFASYSTDEGYYGAKKVLDLLKRTYRVYVTAINDELIGQYNVQD